MARLLCERGMPLALLRRMIGGVACAASFPWTERSGGADGQTFQQHTSSFDRCRSSRTRADGRRLRRRQRWGAGVSRYSGRSRIAWTNRSSRSTRSDRGARDTWSTRPSGVARSDRSARSPRPNGSSRITWPDRSAGSAWSNGSSGITRSNRNTGRAWPNGSSRITRSDRSARRAWSNRSSRDAGPGRTSRDEHRHGVWYRHEYPHLWGGAGRDGRHRSDRARS